MLIVQQDQFNEPENWNERDDLPLVIHCRQKPTQARGLVVLVHGLRGTRYGYWGRLPSFVYRDLPDVDIGLYYYVTALERMRFWRSIPLQEEARVLAGTLRDLVGYRSLFLIGHSMGGILAKAAISELILTKATRSLRRIAGLALLASPQLGSLSVPGFFRIFSKDARALYPHNSFLRSVDDTLSAHLDFRETANPGSQRAIPVWALIAARDFWVDPLSAGIAVPSTQRRTFRGTHLSIAAPTTAQAPPYIWLRERLDSAFKGERKKQITPQLVCEDPLPRDVPGIREFAHSIFNEQVTPEADLYALIGIPGLIQVVRRITGTPTNRREVLEGYFCILPLTARSAEDLRRGRIGGDALGPVHLANNPDSIAAIYVGAVGARNWRSKALVLQALRQKVNELARHAPLELLARPVTEDGVRTATDHGLRPKYEVGKRPLYSLHFDTRGGRNDRRG